MPPVCRLTRTTATAGSIHFIKGTDRWSVAEQSEYRREAVAPPTTKTAGYADPLTSHFTLKAIFFQAVPTLRYPLRFPKNRKSIC
jgi:hypothetical protein